MPDEPVVPPQQLPRPERLSDRPTLNAKQKKQIIGALVVVVSIAIVSGIVSDMHRAKEVPKPKPVQHLEAPPPAAVAPPPAPNQTLAPPPPAIVQPAPYALGGPVYQEPAATPEKTLKQQLAEERLQLAAKSAFDDNLVSSSSSNRHEPTEPEPGTGSTHGGIAVPPQTTPVSGPSKHPSLDFDPNQPTVVLPFGTVINCVLVNKLIGDFTGPVLAQVSTPVYELPSRRVLIPQGSRFFGEAQKVGSSGFGQERLAVAFHQLLIPTAGQPYSVPLDMNLPGLDQEGATALKDKVNNHYFQIFGASLAIGAVGGLAQIGNSYGINGYNSGAQFRNGLTQSMAESSMRVLDRFLNRPPTITIRPGTRVDILLTDNLAIPVYGE